MTYFAVDRLGNREAEQTLTVRIDRTAPEVTGLPVQPCVIWPPDEKHVRVADIVGAALSGLADLDVSATSSEPAGPADIVIEGGRVWVRATRDGEGPGRTYTVLATATDNAGNTTTRQARAWSRTTSVEAVSDEEEGDQEPRPTAGCRPSRCRDTGDPGHDRERSPGADVRRRYRAAPVAGGSRLERGLCHERPGLGGGYLRAPTSDGAFIGSSKAVLWRDGDVVDLGIEERHP